MALPRIIQAAVKRGTPSAFPNELPPMLATLGRGPFTDAGWIHEVKFDGYRIVAHKHKHDMRLKTRGGQDYTRQYSPIAEALAKLKHDMVLDGEVVVLDQDGRPDYNGLQNYRDGMNIVYYVFDIVWLNGYDLCNLALFQRRKILESLIIKTENVQVTDIFEDGLALYEKMEELHLEGIVAKKRDSPYAPGIRSKNWLKVPLHTTQEYVIGGWVDSENNRPFGGLLIGHYKNGQLWYVDHAGGGFTQKGLSQVYKRLLSIERKKSPFANPVKMKKKIHWCEPLLVADFKVSGRHHKSGRIRHPAIFLRLRHDKSPQEVVAEFSSDIKKMKNKTAPRPKLQGWERVKAEKQVHTTDELKVGGKKLQLTNLQQSYWKGVTKLEVIKYYNNMFDYFIAYVKNRPLGLNVSFNVVTEDAEFIRNLEENVPVWAKVFETERKHKKAGKSDSITWLLCNDRATMTHILNLDCLDFHPWNSRISKPGEPDYIVIDLDPSDDDFSKAVETARAAKTYFDEKKLACFIKTSGKTGLHLFLPASGIEYGDARRIASRICQEVHERVPDITTLETLKANRGARLYVDPSQNDYADRVASAYCLRAYKHPNISTPLEWKEVNRTLCPEDFTIRTLEKRIAKKGDLWAALLDRKVQHHNAKIMKGLL